ncbi:MAG TPA: hypothetical protein VFV04_02185 [Burkholderiales bacterium]|nr:hypothetical protein [Burkholderiales bacterium]
MVIACVRARRRLAGTLLVAIVTAGLAACGGGGVYKPFNAIDEKRPIKPASIAVISGSHQDGDVKLAGFVTKQLAERTTFRVLSQEEIGKRAPGYPSAIRFKKSEEIEDDDEKVVWFVPSEKAKLDALQARLKVDYLFVLWIRRMTVVSGGNSGTTYYVYPGGNLIEYPGGRVVASTRMGMGSSASILALFRSKDYYIVDAIELSAEAIVDDVIKVTKSKK